MNQAPMIGARAPMGPGGRRCVCCAPPPGPPRVAVRRTMKRAERNAWKRAVAKGAC